MKIKCPKCDNEENLHINDDHSGNYDDMEVLCNECGTFFMKKKKIDWHKELLDRGFEYLHESTRTYGYKSGKMTGSIRHEKDGRIMEPDYEPKFIGGKRTVILYPKNAIEIFVPFFADEKFQSVRLRSLIELDEYIKKIEA